MLRISESVEGASVAPATPSSARVAINMGALVEKAASTEVFAVLKRPDEKYVTEAAFDNPKFVEDIVRDLALLLDAEERITWFSINSENYESIHNHNAYAQLTRDKRGS